VVTAFGAGGKFVEHVADELRCEGRKVGYLRPITLWPFSEEALERAAERAFVD
jgi:2-oxoglutarate ferredoxin oxidoreductase subunit alpha